MTPLILITGANGYIASRLIPRLLERGYGVRAMAREPDRLAGRRWTRDVEIVSGSTHDAASLSAAMRGVDAAFYLIHNMARGRGYAQVEKETARVFAAAAAAAGIQHILYLGGLADPTARNLAPHMRSRIETGQVLRQGPVPVTEFRAGVIVGAGSISFEMIRFLTEAFPIMPGPSWLRNRAQPIASRNVVDYLVSGLETPTARGKIFEMGGPERMSYAETMLRYARHRGLRRLLFTLPGIPIAFMARFVDWLTPVPFPIGVALVGGLQSESVVLDAAARSEFPEIDPIPFEQAMALAMDDLLPERLEPVWEGLPGTAISMRHEGFFIDHRRMAVAAPAPRVFEILTRMGGRHGWPYANGLWRLRGWIDRLVSGGLRMPPAAARPGDSSLQVGDRVDYYVVEEVAASSVLRLHSVLRAPGDGWMEWRLVPSGSGALLKQTAFFAPRGLPGFLYWYLLAPFHSLVFQGLIRAIKREAESS
jgi:uncharacterized protein YbjT (DUF2867 family)